MRRETRPRKRSLPCSPQRKSVKNKQANMTGHTATSSIISEKPVRKLTKPRHVAQRRHHEKWQARPDACKNDRIALQANLVKTVTPFEMVATHERNCSDNAGSVLLRHWAGCPLDRPSRVLSAWNSGHTCLARAENTRRRRRKQVIDLVVVGRFGGALVSPFRVEFWAERS